MTPPSDPRLPAGVLLDCDGTLADTEPLADRAWREVLARYGYEATDEDFAAVIGHAWPRSFEHFAQRAPLGDPVTFRAELRSVAVGLYDRELVLFDDAVATLRALVAMGVPVAVVSSSSHAHVERCLAAGDLRDLVGVIVGAEDVEAHKPDPEPYLAAAAALGLPPERCTSVEDTAVGVAAATAAGTFTVAVTRGRVDPATLAAADRLVERVTLEALVPRSRGTRRGPGTSPTRRRTIGSG